jgi:REP element-mobilizing transposase RayT
MNNHPPHSKDLRKGRVSLDGQAYLVTSVTLNRLPIFADYRLGRVLVNVMREYAEKGDVESHAFIVMPDHFHWLFTLSGECTLSKLIGQVKGATAYRIGQILAPEGAPTTGNLCRSGFSRDRLIAPEGAPTESGFSRDGSGRDNRLWQKGFHDRALRRDEDVRTVARYTVLNPVRAGIVSRIWDYPLWDAVWVDSSKFDLF